MVTKAITAINTDWHGDEPSATNLRRLMKLLNNKNEQLESINKSSMTVLENKLFKDVITDAEFEPEIECIGTYRDGVANITQAVDEFSYDLDIKQNDHNSDQNSQIGSMNNGKEIMFVSQN